MLQAVTGARLNRRKGGTDPQKAHRNARAPNTLPRRCWHSTYGVGSGQFNLSGCAFSNCHRDLGFPQEQPLPQPSRAACGQTTTPGRGFYPSLCLPAAAWRAGDFSGESPPPIYPTTHPIKVSESCRRGSSSEIANVYCRHKMLGRLEQVVPRM